MTLTTLTFFAVTGGVMALKLAIMVVAVVLLASALSSGRGHVVQHAAKPALHRKKDAGR